VEVVDVEVDARTRISARRSLRRSVLRRAALRAHEPCLASSSAPRCCVLAQRAAPLWPATQSCATGSALIAAGSSLVSSHAASAPLPRTRYRLARPAVPRCGETLCLLGGLVRPRPPARCDAPIELFDHKLDEVTARKVSVGLAEPAPIPPQLFEWAGLENRLAGPRIRPSESSSESFAPISCWFRGAEALAMQSLRRTVHHMSTVHGLPCFPS
jgi:hypothetical protein